MLQKQRTSTKPYEALTCLAVKTNEENHDADTNDLIDAMQAYTDADHELERKINEVRNFKAPGPKVNVVSRELRAVGSRAGRLRRTWPSGHARCRR